MITFTYDGDDYTFPGSLSEITLQQFIDWHTAVGEPLAVRRLELNSITDPDLKSLHTSMIFLDEATRSFAYYTGIPVEEVQESFDFQQLIVLYTASGLQMVFEEADITVLDSYDFDGDTWNIRTPAQSISEDMTHAEFSATMDLARIMLEFVEKHDWASFKKICAAYFRKVDEVFDPSLLIDGDPRMVLMESLPMDIALAVGYFLKSSLDIFLQTLDNYAENTLHTP